jgi:Rhodopirellula transposase DDE domain/Winged helix-turn helix
MPNYSLAIEDQMRSFYQSLSEKDRRRYAAVEAAKLGRGGISYIAQVLECDRHTIRHGLEELGDPEALSQRRIRCPGGGRKPREDALPDLESAFVQVLQDHTAGSPMNSDIKWTNLTRQQIKEHLAQDHGIAVSVTVVKRLLKQHGFVRRQAQKRTRTGEHAERDAQFQTIAKLKDTYLAKGNPVVSIDTKKKN